MTEMYLANEGESREEYNRRKLAEFDERFPELYVYDGCRCGCSPDYMSATADVREFVQKILLR